MRQWHCLFRRQQRQPFSYQTKLALASWRLSPSRVGQGTPAAASSDGRRRCLQEGGRCRGNRSQFSYLWAAESLEEAWGKVILTLFVQLSLMYPHVYTCSAAANRAALLCRVCAAVLSLLGLEERCEAVCAFLHLCSFALQMLWK